MTRPGKAVLFSGVTVLIALTAVMLVPSPAFRSMALGIMISVIFILGATLTLLPELGSSARGSTSFPFPGSIQGEHCSARFAAWGERLWRRPMAYGSHRLVLLVALAFPVLSLKTGMPSIRLSQPVTAPESAMTRSSRPLVTALRARFRSSRPNLTAPDQPQWQTQTRVWPRSWNPCPVREAPL